MIFQIIIFGYLQIGALLSAVYVFTSLYYSWRADISDVLTLLFLWPVFGLLGILELTYGGISGTIK